MPLVVHRVINLLRFDLLCILLTGTSRDRGLSFTCKFSSVNPNCCDVTVVKLISYSSLSPSSTVEVLWLSTAYAGMNVILQ
jgi:hypothetical protein